MNFSVNIVKPEEIKEDEFWLDYSHLSDYLRCPRSYYLHKILNINKLSAALEFGSAVHHCLAHWHIHKDDEHAIKLFKEEASKIRKPDEKRNLSTGQYILRRYFDRWRVEEYSTVHTEIGFALEMNTPKGKKFLFVGKIDRIVLSRAFGILVFETKTSTVEGKKWGDRVKPNMQIDGYYSAYSILTGEEINGAILDVIFVHYDPKKLAKPQRYFTTRTPADIDKWIMNTGSHADSVISCMENGFFPMNTDTCKPLIGFECGYWDLCSMHDTSNIDIVDKLTEDYVIEKWKPFEF